MSQAQCPAGKPAGPIGENRDPELRMRTCQEKKEPYPRIGDAPLPAAGAEEASSGGGGDGFALQRESGCSSDILFSFYWE
jgi:hypothetical protein